MKKSLFAAVAILAIWVLIFLATIIPNERQVSVPEDYPRIILETQPRDPRDLLRGDFVVLQYDFSRRTWNRDGDRVVDNILENNPAGTVVYVSFSVGNDRRATAIDASLTKPKSGTFLKGKIYGKRYWNKEIRFGIERFFVPAGKGWEIEEIQRKNNLEAEIAINPETGKGLVVDLFTGKTKVDFETIEPDIRGW